MQVLKSLEEANRIDAVRLTTKRRFAKIGDIFRLSPQTGTVLWGRVIEQGAFFGVSGPFSLVYVYDQMSDEKPETASLDPHKLIIGPTVVNNLGWTRGYWEIVASEPLSAEQVLPRHLFIAFHGTGSPHDYDIVDRQGKVVRDAGVDPATLSQAGFSNFNHVDWLVRGILLDRGIL